MADEETKPAAPKNVSVKTTVPEVPPIKQDQWLPYLETNSAWMFFTDNVDVQYGENTIAVDGLDYRQSLRAEHAARIILEIYGFQVTGGIEPLRLVIEEA